MTTIWAGEIRKKYADPATTDKDVCQKKCGNEKREPFSCLFFMYCRTPSLRGFSNRRFEKYPSANG